MSDRLIMFATAVFVIVVVGCVCYSLLTRRRRS
jgi:hypothetical protein